MSRGLRESIEATIDGMGFEDEELNESRQEVVTDDSETETETATGEEAGAVTDDQSEGAEVEGDPSSAGDESDAKASSDLTPGTSKNSMKAPVGWSPEERQEWSKIPRPLQERITAREKEMADTMANTKQARETFEFVNKFNSRFENLSRSSGFKHPMEAATVALNTMESLATGDQNKKAQLIANLINQYGIDIETLDNTLVSTPQQRVDPQAARLEQMLAERLKPFEELMTQQQRQQQEQRQQQAQAAEQAVVQFSDNAEFLNDVREDMADIIEAAARRGQELTLQQAYDRACMAHPEIANIIQKNREKEQLMGHQSSIAAKRSAASSISGRKSGAGGGVKGGSLRETIESAMDGLE